MTRYMFNDLYFINSLNNGMVFGCESNPISPYLRYISSGVIYKQNIYKKVLHGEWQVLNSASQQKSGSEVVFVVEPGRAGSWCCCAEPCCASAGHTARPGHRLWPGCCCCLVLWGMGVAGTSGDSGHSGISHSWVTVCRIDNYLVHECISLAFLSLSQQQSTSFRVTYDYCNFYIQN